MAAPAETHPSGASLPLDGGREQATLTLRPLLCGEIPSPPGWFERGQGPTATLKALGVGVEQLDALYS